MRSTPSGGSAQPAMVQATVQFSPTPANAEITIDGVLVDGGVAQVELSHGKKVVKIIAKASGYRTYEKKVTITGDQVVAFKMSKRSAGSSGHSGTGPGDKIDLGKIDM